MFYREVGNVRSLSIAAAILLALSSVGSSCVNDGVMVSVNLNPIVGRFRLGTNTTFAGALIVKLDSLISSEYKNKIRQGRVYDLKVRVEGDYSGAVSGIVAIRIDGDSLKPILRFPKSGSANWSVFRTSQSLLERSPYLSPQSEGIDILLRALTTSPMPNVTVATLGTLSVAPVPDNLYVNVEVYLQADVEVN